MSKHAIKKLASHELSSRQHDKDTYTIPLVVQGASDEQVQKISDFLLDLKRSFKDSTAKKQLDKYPVVQEFYDEFVVSGQINESEFWQRYMFRCDKDRIIQELEMEPPAKIKERVKQLKDQSTIKNSMSDFGAASSSIGGSFRLVSEDRSSLLKKPNSLRKSFRAPDLEDSKDALLLKKKKNVKKGKPELFHDPMEVFDRVMREEFGNYKESDESGWKKVSSNSLSPIQKDTNVMETPFSPKQKTGEGPPEVEVPTKIKAKKDSSLSPNRIMDVDLPTVDGDEDVKTTKIKVRKDELLSPRRGLDAGGGLSPKMPKSKILALTTPSKRKSKSPRKAKSLVAVDSEAFNIPTPNVYERQSMDFGHSEFASPVFSKKKIKKKIILAPKEEDEEKKNVVKCQIGAPAEGTKKFQKKSLKDVIDVESGEGNEDKGAMKSPNRTPREGKKKFPKGSSKKAIHTKPVEEATSRDFLPVMSSVTPKEGKKKLHKMSSKRGLGEEAGVTPIRRKKEKKITSPKYARELGSSGGNLASSDEVDTGFRRKKKKSIVIGDDPEADLHSKRRVVGDSEHDENDGDVNLDGAENDFAISDIQSEEDGEKGGPPKQKQVPVELLSENDGEDKATEEIQKEKEDEEVTRQESEEGGQKVHVITDIKQERDKILIPEYEKAGTKEDALPGMAKAPQGRSPSGRLQIDLSPKHERQHKEERNGLSDYDVVPGKESEIASRESGLTVQMKGEFSEAEKERQKELLKDQLRSLQLEDLENENAMDSHRKTRESLITEAQAESSKIKKDKSQNSDMQPRNEIFNEEIQSPVLQKTALTLRDPMHRDETEKPDKDQATPSQEQNLGAVLSRFSVLSPIFQTKKVSLEEEKFKQKELLKEQFRSLDLDLEDEMESQKEKQDFLVKLTLEESASRSNNDEFDDNVETRKKEADGRDEHQERNPLSRLSRAVWDPQFQKAALSSFRESMQWDEAKRSSDTGQTGEEQHQNLLRRLSKVESKKRMRKTRVSLEEDLEDMSKEMEIESGQERQSFLGRLLSPKPKVQIRVMSSDGEKERQQTLIKEQFRSLNLDLDDAMDIQKQTQDPLVHHQALENAISKEQEPDTGFSSMDKVDKFDVEVKVDTSVAAIKRSSRSKHKDLLANDVDQPKTGEDQRESIWGNVASSWGGLLMPPKQDDWGANAITLEEQKRRQEELMKEKLKELGLDVDEDAIVREKEAQEKLIKIKQDNWDAKAITLEEQKRRQEELMKEKLKELGLDVDEDAIVREKEAQEKLIKTQMEGKNKEGQVQVVNEPAQTNNADQKDLKPPSGGLESDVDGEIGEEQQTLKKGITIFDQLSNSTRTSWFDSWNNLSGVSKTKDTASVEVGALELEKRRQEELFKENLKELNMDFEADGIGREKEVQENLITKKVKTNHNEALSKMDSVVKAGDVDKDAGVFDRIRPQTRLDSWNAPSVDIDLSEPSQKRFAEAETGGNVFSFMFGNTKENDVKTNSAISAPEERAGAFSFFNLGGQKAELKGEDLAAICEEEGAEGETDVTTDSKNKQTNESGEMGGVFSLWGIAPKPHVEVEEAGGDVLSEKVDRKSVHPWETETHPWNKK